LDILHIIENSALPVIIGILAIHHVLHISYELFRWPAWLATRHARHRTEELKEVLNSLGMDDSVRDDLRGALVRKRIADAVGAGDSKDRCIRLLSKCVKAGSFQVGKHEAKTFPLFFDVMGDCLEPDVNEQYAAILSSYLHEYHKYELPIFDRIVGIKGGSPTLAYSFAARIGKPVSLFRGVGNPKHVGGNSGALSLFDGEIARGEKILLVDDSTTSGRMAIECIECLREAGCSVSDFLVLFEPVGLSAREKLIKRDVRLLAVVTLDSSTLTKIKSQLPRR
jgi:orotate phosphoribosyltransferase